MQSDPFLALQEAPRYSLCRLEAAEAAVRMRPETSDSWLELAQCRLDALQLQPALSALKAAPKQEDARVQDMLTLVHSLIRVHASQASLRYTTEEYTVLRSAFRQAVLHSYSSVATKHLHALVHYVCALRLPFLVPDAVICIAYFASRLAENGDQYAATILPAQTELKTLALVSSGQYEEARQQNVTENSVRLTLLLAAREGSQHFAQLVSDALDSTVDPAIRADIYRIAAAAVDSDNERSVLAASAAREAQLTGDNTKWPLPRAAKHLITAQKAYWTINACFNLDAKGFWTAKF